MYSSIFTFHIHFSSHTFMSYRWFSEVTVTSSTWFIQGLKVTWYACLLPSLSIHFLLSYSYIFSYACHYMHKQKRYGFFLMHIMPASELYLLTCYQFSYMASCFPWYPRHLMVWLSSAISAHPLPDKSVAGGTIFLPNSTLITAVFRHQPITVLP